MSRQKLIFIVDDDPFINMLVKKRLASDDYIVEAFEYGDDCLNALKKNPDLIILDFFFCEKWRKPNERHGDFRKDKGAEAGHSGHYAFRAG